MAPRAEIPVRSFAISLVVLKASASGCEVLLLRRTGTLKGEWCQVAGGLEHNETAWQAAMRELSEETGLVPERLFSADVCEQFYEPDRDAITLTPVFVAFVSDEQEVILNDEHDAFRWVSFQIAKTMVPFPGQRQILDHIEREFVAREPSSLLLIETRTH